MQVLGRCGHNIITCLNFRGKILIVSEYLTFCYYPSPQLEMSGEKSGSLRSEIEMSKKKERLWSSELTQLTSDLQLAREKMAQLEREKAGLKAELTRVTLLLEHTQGEVVCDTT